MEHLVQNARISLNVPYSEYLDPCPSNCIQTSGATRTNKRVNRSFVTIVAYGKFLFLSIIGAKHARICPIFPFCTPHVILHKIETKKYDLPVHQKSQVFQGILIRNVKFHEMAN